MGIPAPVPPRGNPRQLPRRASRHLRKSLPGVPLIAWRDPRWAGLPFAQEMLRPALEMAGVDRDRAALVVGRERGFTFRVYNPEGLEVGMLREVVEAVRLEGQVG